jgi:tripartite-type tricarboxylate transporter receptor subunit TctC
MPKLIAAALVLFSTLAGAEGFPSKPLRLVVPAAAGGTVDILARAISAPLSEGLGQPVLVENRPGAGTNIGMEAVVRSDADGHTILVGGVPVATNRVMYPKLPFDPASDLAPVTLLVTSGNVLVVHPSLPVHSVKELIAYAKERPGQLNFGSPATGSTPHLAGELFNHLAGVKLVHVPYKGAAPALNDLIGGRLQLSFDNIPPALPHIRSGRLRALAVTSAQRQPDLPELPTIAEAGLPGFEVSAWFGLLVPAATPAESVKRLESETAKVLAIPAVHERLTQLGFHVDGRGATAYRAYIRAEAERWTPVIRSLGIKAD